MDDPSNDSTQKKNRDVLFQSAYGGIPKFVLYRVIPFMLLATVFLFAIADSFKGRFALKGVQLSPERVRFVLCPAILLMCAVIIGLEVYRRLHPQSIAITKDELLLPKGRFNSDIIRIRWNDLEATLWSGQISFMDVYEVTCLDGLRGTKILIASNLFRDFDDFATFALIVGEYMGQD